MSNLTQITAQSTVGDLPLSDFQVSPSTLGEVVAHQFNRRSDIPGVIITNDSQVLGMISRQEFNKQMENSERRTRFLHCSIKHFLSTQQEPIGFLQLSDTEKIDIAIRKALSRPSNKIYDPIAIAFNDPSLPDFKAFFLLDFQTLLLAQSQLMESLNQEVDRQRLEMKNCVQKFHQKQRKIREHKKLLEIQKIMIQERNLLLETQQIELLEQAKEISQFNLRLIRIRKLLTGDGKNAFSKIFSGVNSICQTTTQVIGIGRSLSHELKTIRETSKLIEEVSRQVKHLAVQAVIVANHASSELSGFSPIASEIGKLVGQTFEAAGKTQHVADRFRARLEELTESAYTGTTVARSLVGEIERSENVLSELERLVQLERSAMIPEIGEESEEEINSLEKRKTLVRKIAQAETTLSELKRSVRRNQPDSLIEKIRRTLKHHKQYE
ncbi:hypothetical protein [Lusitaniella coriacea]|uniref:hypothetical protein n=1 Tax=Lusitaniella coriacea TaxID=1983105 RepID=UPI003CEBEF81